jgi:hypothetical protein
MTMLPAKIRQLYALVGELEAMHPGRRFTLDGHLIGSIGEVLAAYHYQLELLPASAPTHDAKSQDGRLVQIKATQANLVGLRSEPQHLLVLGLDRQGHHFEVFNGPGEIAWAAAGKMQKNGQRPIRKNTLLRLMESVPPAARLKRRED